MTFQTHKISRINIIFTAFLVLSSTLMVSADSHQGELDPLIIILPSIFLLVIAIIAYKNWWMPKNELDTVRDNIARGIKMTNSTIASKRKEARTIFENILTGPTVDGYVSLLAGLSLSEYMIMELKINASEEKVTEFRDLFTNLSKIAAQFELNNYQIHLQLLLAKLNMCLGELDDAKANIARVENILANSDVPLDERSEEEKELIFQNEDLENALESNSSLKHKLKLVKFDDHVIELIDDLKKKVPGVSGEVPVTMLIMNNEGKTVFSMNFLFGLIIDDLLYDGFVTAIESYSDEIYADGEKINTFTGNFSDEVDYINYGQFTIILKAEKNLLLSYVIKGKSETAQQKLSDLTNQLKREEEVWDNLLSASEDNKITKNTKNKIVENVESTYFR